MRIGTALALVFAMILLGMTVKAAHIAYNQATPAGALIDSIRTGSPHKPAN